MRKSIFLTVIMALFMSAGTYAQNLGAAVTCPGIQTLNCTATANALNPMPGQSYTYEVNVSPQGGEYNWFVTTDPQFITAGVLTTSVEDTTGDIILAAGEGYHDVTKGKNQQSITWQAAPATADVFLVIHYKAPAANCGNDNLKVYKINILNNFAIDVYNITAAGSNTTTLGTNSSNLDVCAPQVNGAKYNSASSKMEYDYGTTYLYYVVAAGNFIDEWELEFKVDASLDANQSMTVSWNEDGTGTWKDLTASSSSVYSVVLTGNSGFNSDDCIVVRVAITNSTYESLVDQDIELFADATTGGKKDVTTSCAVATPFSKGAIQTIKARPTVTSTTSDGVSGTVPFILP